MTKALFCIVPDGFRDEEYSIPKKIFEKNNITVVTASTLSGNLTGKCGLTIATVDILLEQARASDYDCLVIVGGQDTFWNNPKIISLLQEMNSSQKAIGAICISGVLPAQAGLLRGKKSTVFATPESLAELKRHGAIYTGELVTVADNIVTANGPEAAKAFAEKLLNVIHKKVS